MVAEDDDESNSSKALVSEDFTTAYWERRYTLRAQQVPAFLVRSADKVETPGGTNGGVCTYGGGGTNGGGGGHYRVSLLWSPSSLFCFFFVGLIECRQKCFVDKEVK